MQCLPTNCWKEPLPFSPSAAKILFIRAFFAGVSERLFNPKRRRSQLERKDGSIDELEIRLKTEGATPDDHTLYRDLLEWRAIDHELSELLVLFEAV